MQGFNEIDNASSDGWDTEVFSDAATKQFEELKHVLLQADSWESSALDFIADDETRVNDLFPKKLATVFQDSAIRVQRGELAAESTGPEDELPGRGSAGLAESLRALLVPFRDMSATRMKIKIFRVEKTGDAVETLQTLEVFGPTESGVQEITAIWRAQWTDDRKHPLLKQLEVTDFETAESCGHTLFADCTESVLAGNASFRNQLLRGYDYWLDQSQFLRFFILLGTPGIAIGDVNSDDLEDLYVCQEGGLPNLLFLQQADGTLRDASRESGADWLQPSRNALIIDLDNDGKKDLAVGMEGGVVLAQGDGTGKFVKRAVLDSSDDVMAIAAADYDLDGRLDLFVGAYDPNESNGEELTAQAINTPGFVYYNAKNGGPNSLFHNDVVAGDWKFSDATQSVGLNQDNARYTLAAAWEDFDNDGDQDLFVANDFGPKNLFRNDRNADGSRAFVDIAGQSSAEDSGSGMSIAWGDYNRDGWMDAYSSNMFSYAGNRITFQNQFKPEVESGIRQTFQRFARGNSLLQNAGPPDGSNVHQFEDRSLEAAVNRGRWAWGSGFVDVNNDGWDDIVVANGYITADGTGDS